QRALQRGEREQAGGEQHHGDEHLEQREAGAGVLGRNVTHGRGSDQYDSRSVQAPGRLEFVGWMLLAKFLNTSPLKMIEAVPLALFTCPCTTTAPYTAAPAFMSSVAVPPELGLILSPVWSCMAV